MSKPVIETLNPYVVAAATSLLVCVVVRALALWRRGRLTWEALNQAEQPLFTPAAAAGAATGVALAYDGYDGAAFGIALVILWLAISVGRSQVGRKQSWASAVLGVVTGLTVMTAYWLPNLSDQLSAPEDVVRTATLLLSLFGVLLVLGEGLVAALHFSRLSQLPTSRRLKRALRLSVNGPALVGVAASLLLRAQIGGFTHLGWVAVAAAWIIIATAYEVKKTYLLAPVRLREEALHFRGKPGTRPTAKSAAKPATKPKTSKAKSKTTKKPASKAKSKTSKKTTRQTKK